MYQMTPPKGMRDFLPGEKALRDVIASRIREAYTDSGFTEIETSIIEHLDNLTGGDGGENTKLIYKILKRGEKFDEAMAKENAGENDLSDLGLRFDFTLPLTRFYANNRNELPQVFKSIQMGTVFRGERPQKGRFRAFTQCDVDVIGDPTPLAEIEILNAAIKALSAIGLNDFEILISDRRFLLAIIAASGLPADRADEVCISLDKMDKIGKDGVLAELKEKGLDGSDLLSKIEKLHFDDIAEYSAEAHENLQSVLRAFSSPPQPLSSESAFTPKFRFEPTLVRGMGYYTSTIFEIYSPKYGSALGGGGRYDKMIGKICGTDAPAAGFSIGFERICDLLGEEYKNRFSRQEKTAVLISDPSEYAEALQFANAEQCTASIFVKKKKLGKQLQNLENEGFTKYYDVTKKEYLSRHS